jgi:hypothetical protein
LKRYYNTAKIAGLVEKALVNKEDRPFVSLENLTPQNNHLFSIRHFSKKIPNN